MEQNLLLKDHLHKLENKLLTPQVRSSPEELQELLADDFFEFGSSGRVWRKEDCIVQGGISVRKMTIFDFEIHPLSEDHVLITYQLKDETRKQATLRSSVWKFKDGRWQIFFHQGTPI